MLTNDASQMISIVNVLDLCYLCKKQRPQHSKLRGVCVNSSIGDE